MLERWAVWPLTRRSRCTFSKGENITETALHLRQRRADPIWNRLRIGARLAPMPRRSVTIQWLIVVAIALLLGGGALAVANGDAGSNWGLGAAIGRSPVERAPRIDPASPVGRIAAGSRSLDRASARQFRPNASPEVRFPSALWVTPRCPVVPPSGRSRFDLGLPGRP